MTRGRLRGLIVTALCAVASIALFALVSDFLVLAGSTPATVLGPTLAPVILQAAVAVTVILIGITMIRSMSGYARLAVFILWLVVLSVSTHRVVDGDSDGITDIWLGVPVATDRRYQETDEKPHGCRAMLLPALCFTRGGNRRVIVTVLPFDQMTIGSDGKPTPAR